MVLGGVDLVAVESEKYVHHHKGDALGEAEPLSCGERCKIRLGLVSPLVPRSSKGGLDQSLIPHASLSTVLLNLVEVDRTDRRAIHPSGLYQMAELLCQFMEGVAVLLRAAFINLHCPLKVRVVWSQQHSLLRFHEENVVPSSNAEALNNILRKGNRDRATHPTHHSRLYHSILQVLQKCYKSTTFVEPGQEGT